MFEEHKNSTGESLEGMYMAEWKRLESSEHKNQEDDSGKGINIIDEKWWQARKMQIIGLRRLFAALAHYL